MKLTEVISKKAIIHQLKSKDKRGVVTELVRAIRKANEAEKFSAPAIVEAILDREKLGSTGIGGGVAVPHCKLDAVKGVVGAFGRTTTGLDFNAVDGEPVHLVFVILSPPSRSEAYLQALQKVMVAVKRPTFSKFLRGAKTAKEIEEIFRELEEVATV